MKPAFFIKNNIIRIINSTIMKKILFIMAAICLLASSSKVSAQEYEYVPFVREGVKWVYEESLHDYPWYTNHTLELKGDMEINGKSYKAMHKYSGEEINWENDTIPVYLREEDKVVYGIVPDGKTYDDCPVGMATDESMMEKIAAGEEFILYDFNEVESFMMGWIVIPPSWITHPIIHDQTTIAGRMVNRYMARYFYHDINDFCMIEGIGYDAIRSAYPLSVSDSYTGGVRLSYVVQSGEVIYRSERYKQPYEGPAEFLPIAREGVKWVNERVIIDHGDTTSYYYTYEFHGKTTYHDLPICYQYTGDDLNSGDASVAAIGTSNRSPAFTDVVPFSGVVEAGRDMIHYGREININAFSYKFGNYTDIGFSNTVNFYIYFQRGDFLNRENFVEVEPLTIEGMTCRRYAYMDDNGEPLAYITEGIGFDSRDLGDLLTPFTLKPDPDADHQEYWGLSHVIKDGEIIYKGMRYHEENVESLEGDVNGDGEVNIEDLSALIDLLLESTPMFKQNSDVNSDGQISIGDVSALIDKLLSMN